MLPKKAAATLYIILLHFWGFGGVGDWRLRGILIKIWPVFLSILEWESTSCSYIPCWMKSSNYFGCGGLGFWGYNVSFAANSTRNHRIISSYHPQELKPQEDTHIRQILRQQRLHTFIGCEQTTRTILVIYSAFES